MDQFSISIQGLVIYIPLIFIDNLFNSSNTADKKDIFITASSGNEDVSGFFILMGFNQLKLLSFSEIVEVVAIAARFRLKMIPTPNQIITP